MSYLGQLVIGLWWPLENRECVLEGFACDDPENQNVVIVSNSIEKHPDPSKDIPDVPKGSVRITMKGGLKVSFESPETVHMTVIYQFDPQAYVPQSLLNWFSGKFFHVMMQQLINGAQYKDDSKMAKLVKENPKKYERIR